MTSSRPYLIRAMYQWISDNALTPYVLVNAENPQTVVPRQFVEDGKIVLNISNQAVDNLHIDNDWLMFSARFNGKAMDISIPVIAIQAIYAKENGQGMMFAQEEDKLPPTDPEPGPGDGDGRKRHLKLVK